MAPGSNPGASAVVPVFLVLWTTDSPLFTCPSQKLLKLVDKALPRLFADICRIGPRAVLRDLHDRCWGHVDALHLRGCRHRAHCLFADRDLSRGRQVFLDALAVHLIALVFPWSRSLDDRVDELLVEEEERSFPLRDIENELLQQRFPAQCRA